MYILNIYFLIIERQVTSRKTNAPEIWTHRRQAVLLHQRETKV